MPPVDGGPDDCELLCRMADQARDLSARREAWGVFYGRHARYLHGACARAHSKLIGIDRVPDAVSDTFLRAYEKAATFKLSGASPEDQQRAVRAWLVRINENIVRDYFRSAPGIAFVEDSELERRRDAHGDVEPTSGGPVDGRIRLLEEGLDGLSEREQRVLRETVFWYVDGARQQRMPHAAMERLAKELDTTPVNIRQMRARAMATLRQYVLDRS
jgi:RNA polymerase sigma factor (sigma-70 family)